MEIDGDGRGIQERVCKRGRGRGSKKINASLGRLGGSGAATNAYRQGRGEDFKRWHAKAGEETRDDDHFQTVQDPVFIQFSHQ